MPHTVKNRHYVPALKLHYIFDGENMVFEDGVVYTMKEAIILAKGLPDATDLKAVHIIKKLFDGQLTDGDRDAKIAPYLPYLDGEMRKAPAVPVVPVMAGKKQKRIRGNPDQLSMIETLFKKD